MIFAATLMTAIEQAGSDRATWGSLESLALRFVENLVTTADFAYVGGEGLAASFLFLIGAACGYILHDSLRRRTLCGAEAVLIGVAIASESILVYTIGKNSFPKRYAFFCRLRAWELQFLALLNLYFANLW